MPNWLRSAIGWSILALMVLVLFSASFAVTLWLGFAWALIILVVAGALLGWVVTREPDGWILGIYVIAGWVVMAVGLVAGAVGRLFL